MDTREIVRNNLKYAVKIAGGYDNLAEKSTRGSAKYFEQVATGFMSGKDKTPRSLGPVVAASVANAIGKDAEWMYQNHADLWGEDSSSAQELDASFSNNAKKPIGVIKLQGRRENLPNAIEDVIKLMMEMDDVGRGRVLERAAVIAEMHPKANHAESTQ